MAAVLPSSVLGWNPGSQFRQQQCLHGQPGEGDAFSCEGGGGIEGDCWEGQRPGGRQQRTDKASCDRPEDAGHPQRGLCCRAYTHWMNDKSWHFTDNALVWVFFVFVFLKQHCVSHRSSHFTFDRLYVHTHVLKPQQHNTTQQKQIIVNILFLTLRTQFYH